MRNEGLLLFRQGRNPLDTKKYEGKVADKEVDRCCCSDVLEFACDNGERVRVAVVLDCCDCEVMSWVATTKGIDAGLVGDLMMQAVTTPITGPQSNGMAENFVKTFKGDYAKLAHRPDSQTVMGQL